MDETKEVEVIAPEGRRILGYGSRKKGEIFVLPIKLADELVEQQPKAFRAIDKKEIAEEAGNDD